MAVSIDIYRQSIVLYQLSGAMKIKSFNKKSSSSKVKGKLFENTRKHSLSDFISCCIFYLIFFLIFNANSFNVTNANIKNIEKNSSSYIGSIPHGWRIAEYNKNCVNVTSVNVTNANNAV